MRANAIGHLSVTWHLTLLRSVAQFALRLGRPSLVGELDLETMPDHLKRDLGFLDGPDPRYEDDRRR